MVERSLSMREVPGSIPGFSTVTFFFSLSHSHNKTINNTVVIFFLLATGHDQTNGKEKILFWGNFAKKFTTKLTTKLT